ncbi:MAG: nuclear transport factor 2 family protein [Solirubrobacterales bacterium]
MSQENVEIVRRAYARFDARGPNPEFLDPEIEWRGPREFPDLAEPHFGHEGVERYMDKLKEAFDDYHMASEEFIDGPRSRRTAGVATSQECQACQVVDSLRPQ